MMSLTLWTQLDACGFAVLRVLLSVLWQSSILFAAVAGLSWLLRKRRASARHAVWLIALLLTPTLPLLASWVESAGVPQAPVSVMPAYGAPEAEQGAIGPISRIGPIGQTGPISPETSPAQLAAAKELPDRSPVDPLDFPWALAVLAYAVCLAGSLSWFGLGHLRVFLWTRRAMLCVDPRVRDAFRSAGNRLGLDGVPRLLETGRIAAPVTVGVLRSVVLLPKGLADTLEDAELDAVALHETAHVRRRDALVLSLAALIRAVLFFHPLVWLAAHQLRVLAEHAADDAVLDAAIEPVSYAKLLTRIAEQLPRRTPSPEYAAGIVLSRSAFIQRVEAILSDRRDQIRRLTRWALAGTVVAGVVALGIALAVPLSNKPGPDNWRTTLSNGVTVELLGLTDARDSEEWPWWKPDGVPLERPIVDERIMPYGDPQGVFELDNTREVQVFFRFHGVPSQESQRHLALALECNPDNAKPESIQAYRFTNHAGDDQTRLDSWNIIVPKESSILTVRYGIAILGKDENGEKLKARDEDYEWAEFRRVALAVDSDDPPSMRVQCKLSEEESTETPGAKPRETEDPAAAFTAYCETCRFLLEGNSRAEAAERFREAANLAPSSKWAATALELAGSLDVMDEEDRVFKQPESTDALTEEERLELLVHKLRDVAEQAMDIPGKTLVFLSPRPGSPAVEMRNMGMGVIPRMIALLEDRRPTRSFSGSNNGEHVLRYCDIALQIIAAIACAEHPNQSSTFDPRTERGAYLGCADEETRRAIINRVKTWWHENQHRSESDILREYLQDDGPPTMWYDVLRKERLQVLEAEQGDPPTSADAEAPEGTGNLATLGTFAWQRTDEYIPPVAGYFSDDEQAGKRLDALFDAVDKDRRPADEVLTTVRDGLRRTRYDKGNILRWVGNAFVWGEDPQHSEAIEIMYHAIPLAEGTAIYFGLSVVKAKSPNILKTLADIGMKTDDPNDLHRIAWGCASQKDDLLEYVQPYLKSSDDAVREKADAFARMIRGELKAFEWAAENGKARAEQDFAEQLPELREKLLNGDSATRLETLHFINRNNHIMGIVDDSFLDALIACADDPKAEVRREVARKVGGKWVWSAQEQHPDAVELMLRLSRDDDRETRNRALYFGLATVKDKHEPVIRRLIELALADHDPNQYGRVIWGLKGSGTNTKRVARVMEEFLGGPFSNPFEAASVYFLHQDLFDKEPASAERFKEAIAHYPADLYAFSFDTAESFQPESEDAFWQAFDAIVPEGLDVHRADLWTTSSGFLAAGVTVRGQDARDVLQAALEASPKFRFGKAVPLPPQRQLYLQEVGKLPMPQDDTGADQSDVAAAPRLQLRWVSDDESTGATSELPVRHPREGEPKSLRLEDDIVLDETAFLKASVRPEEGRPCFTVLTIVRPEIEETFGEATAANVGRTLAIVFDGEVLSAPVVQSRITSSAQITGDLTETEAVEIARAINGAQAAPYVFSGIVSDEDGKPVEGALIQWAPIFNRETVPEATTDADGHYRLEARHAGGDFVLMASAHGYAPTWKGLLTLAPPGEDTQIDFELEPGHRLEGVAVDTESGKPLPNVAIKACAPLEMTISSSSYDPYQGMDLPGRDSTSYTDPQGRFLFDSLPAGEVALRVDSEGFSAGMNNCSVDDTIELELWSKQRQPDSIIRGRVVDDATGEPITRFTITASDTEKEFDDPDGHFTFGGLPRYRYRRVWADAEGYATGILRDVLAAQEDEAEEVEFRLKPGSRLEGIVTDGQTGDPIEGVRLLYSYQPTHFDWGGWDFFDRHTAYIPALQRTTTGADGRFHFAEVSGETGTIFVLSDGYARKILRPRERRHDEQTGLVNIGLSPESVVCGIHTRDGKPVRDVRIEFDWTDTQSTVEGLETIREFSHATTDEHGRFRFERLPEGKYHLWVTASDGVSFTSGTQRTFDLGPGETREVNLGEPAGGLTLKGCVLVLGKPKAWCVVTLTPLFECPYDKYVVLSDALGRYSFTGLLPGTYETRLAIPYHPHSRGPGTKGSHPIELTEDMALDLFDHYSFTGLLPGAHETHLPVPSHPYGSGLGTKGTQPFELTEDMELDL